MIFKSINARSKDARLYDIASGAMTNKEDKRVGLFCISFTVYARL